MSYMKDKKKDVQSFNWSKIPEGCKNCLNWVNGVSWKGIRWWVDSRMCEAEILKGMWIDHENVCLKITYAWRQSCSGVEDRIIGEEEIEVLEKSPIWISQSTRKITGVLVATVIVSMKLNPSSDIGSNLSGKERECYGLW